MNGEIIIEAARAVVEYVDKKAEPSHIDQDHLQLVRNLSDCLKTVDGQSNNLRKIHGDLIHKMSLAGIEFAHHDFDRTKPLTVIGILDFLDKS